MRQIKHHPVGMIWDGRGREKGRGGGGGGEGRCQFCALKALLKLIGSKNCLMWVSRKTFGINDQIHSVGGGGGGREEGRERVRWVGG